MEYIHEENGSSSLIAGLSAGISMLLVAGGAIVGLTLRLRYAQRRKEQMWWDVRSDDVQQIKRTMTKSTLSSSIGQSKTNTSEVSQHDAMVCMYKGNVVQQLFLSKGHVSVTNDLLKEFAEIRGFQHHNLLTIIGANLEGDKPYLLTEYCPKGTLQELLLNDAKFELDTNFQCSLILDIVSGLTYMHKVNIKMFLVNSMSNF